MSKQDYAIIDTKVWSPIQSPGLRAARQQLAYDSPKVQEVLSEAFAMMFPSIVVTDDKQKRYQSLNKNGTDIFGKAEPVKNMNDIPKAEMMRLMEGWIRLRRKLQDENYSNDVTAILLNFRVPNPRQSLDRYMLYKSGEDVRLIVRWGYETKEEKAVSLERAISILMDVPLGHMRSILSTTMTPTTSTVPVGPLLEAAASREKAEKNIQEKESKFKVSMAVAAVGLVLLGGGTVALLSSKGGSEEKPVMVVDPVVVEDTEIARVEAANSIEDVAEEMQMEAALEAPQPKATLTEADMMADLVMGDTPDLKSIKAMSVDEMLQQGGESSTLQNDMIGEMMQ